MRSGRLNAAHHSHDHGLELVMSGGVSDSLDRTFRDGRATAFMNFSIGSLLLISSILRTGALQ